MLEFFKHLFGVCGEGHASILTALTSIPFVAFFWQHIKNGYQLLVSYLKRFLRIRY
jgi:hypothetical protein